MLTKDDVRVDQLLDDAAFCYTWLRRPCNGIESLRNDRAVFSELVKIIAEIDALGPELLEPDPVALREEIENWHQRYFSTREETERMRRIVHLIDKGEPQKAQDLVDQMKPCED